MKKLLCGVLALMLLMLGTCIPALAEKLVDSGDLGTIHWELDSKGKLTVTGTGKVENNVQIKYYANKIKTIEIGGEITEIERYAFSEFTSLNKIIFGSEVERIAADAFWGCYKIQSVVFSGSKVEGDFSFLGNMWTWSGQNQLKEVVCPEDAAIRIINNFVISADGSVVYCYLGKSPQQLRIPNEVSSLAQYSLSGEKMKEIFIPKSLNYFPSEAFSVCNQLTDIYFEDISAFVTIDNSCTSIFLTNSFTSVVLPPLLSAYPEFSYGLFYQCKKLKAIAFGDGTPSLGHYTTLNCPAVEKIFVPDSVTHIEQDAIEYSPKLTLMVREGSYAETFAKEKGFKYAYFTPVSGITLSEQALTLKKGKSVTLTAEIAPADATEQTLIWCSSDPKVATVTKGKVKAVGVGSCEIICYASDGSNARTVCSLTVEK